MPNDSPPVHGASRSIDELRKLLVLVPHADRLIGWNFVQIIDILEEVKFALSRRYDLQILQDLDRHLSVHDRIRLFVCEFTAYEEVSLTQFVQKRIKR